MKLFVIFAALIITFFLNTTLSFAFDNYAECKILDQKIGQQFASLSLDEAFLRKEARFGFTGQPYEDGSIRITKVHPDLADEIWEKYDEAILNNEWLLKINGIEVEQLTEGEWRKLTSASDMLTLEVEGYSNKFSLDKKEYSSLVIDDLILDVDDVSEIDTKTSSFHTKFSTTITWRDERLIPILKDIINNSPKPDGSGFFCKLDLEYWLANNLFVPSVSVEKFETKIDEKRQKLWLHLANMPNSDLCESYFTCSDLEQEIGVAYYELQTEYIGRISDIFFMQKFPFDKQTLRYSFSSDLMGNQMNDLDINVTEYGEGFLESAVINLYRPEWNFTSHDWNSDYTFNDYSGQFVQVTHFDFEVNRKSSYFIYKLVLPIIFLIGLSWMVFFINIKELESRLTISVVCFLSLIAYNFVVDDTLPKLGYLTFLDIFILISYLFSGLPTIQTVVVEWYSSNKGITLSHILDRFFRKYYFVSYLFTIVITVISFEILELPNLH